MLATSKKSMGGYSKTPEYLQLLTVGCHFNSEFSWEQNKKENESVPDCPYDENNNWSKETQLFLVLRSKTHHGMNSHVLPPSLWEIVLWSSLVVYYIVPQFVI